MNALMLLLLAASSSVPPEGIIHVSLGMGSAHACAVREDLLLTSRHVVDTVGTRVAWSNMAGQDGTAVTVSVDSARDIAVLRIERGRPGRVWPIAAVAPTRGQRVRIVGYDNDDRDPFRPLVVEAKVLAVDAGRVLYSKSPGPGSSGGCVLNDAGEVEAINSGAATRENGSIRWGAGVSVYGDWAPTLPEQQLPILTPVSTVTNVEEGCR